MNSENLPVLIDAKTEYTRQLSQLLIPRLYEGFVSIYEEATQNCNDDKSLIMFQKFLSKIPDWNEEMLFQEYKRIQDKSNCDWLHDLIMGVFVSHTKVLASIKLQSDPLRDKPLKIKIPQGRVFIHECYKQCAREIWKNPYLLYHKVSQCDQQRNMRETYTLISDNIEETIRRLLPVKTILQEYLGDQYREVDDDIVSEIPANQLCNVKNMVAKEINSTQIVDEDDTDDEYSTISIQEKPAGKHNPVKSVTFVEKAESREESTAEKSKEKSKIEHKIENKTENKTETTPNVETEPKVESNKEAIVNISETVEETQKPQEPNEPNEPEEQNKPEEQEEQEEQEEPDINEQDILEVLVDKLPVSTNKQITSNSVASEEPTKKEADNADNDEGTRDSGNVSEASNSKSLSLSNIVVKKPTVGKVVELDFQKLLEEREASQPASSISSRPPEESSHRQLSYAFQDN